MRVSRFLLSTLKEAPAEAELASFDLSRAILLETTTPPPQASERVELDADDGTGRTTVVVGDDETLYRDGKADASLVEDVDTQTLLAALPLLFKPDARTALVIGLGSGTTARALAEAGLERVDVVEISHSVIRAFGPRLPPNVRIIEDDARALLMGSRETYDLLSAALVLKAAHASGRTKAVKEFVTRPKCVAVDPAQNLFTISPLFGWRQDAFVASFQKNGEWLVGRSPLEQALVAMASPKLFTTEREFLKQNTFQLKYGEFDWRLNDLTGGIPN